MGVQQDAQKLLLKLGSEGEGNDRGRLDFRAEEAAKLADLPPECINDAVDVLEDRGLVQTRRWLGTHPYNFGTVTLTPVGRIETERIFEATTAMARAQAQEPSSQPTREATLRRVPTPVGSPFGFTDEDWERVRLDHNDSTRLIVVLGHQWESTFFDSDTLRENIGRMFEGALVKVKQRVHEPDVSIDYRPLQGGYGGHVFNLISRDIIGSDIAVFETSDRNPNVMIEVGVSLTWGVRTLLIREHDSPVPPSDISGQTWAEYSANGARWSDSYHNSKMEALVEQALQKKLARRR